MCAIISGHVLINKRTGKEMSNQPDSIPNPDLANIYQIRVKGCLDSEWSHWFDNMTITPDEDGATLLSGPVVDDAALHGLLKKVRDLGMPLLSVTMVDPDQPDG